MQIVFATTTTTVSTGPGSHTVVHEGEHWYAADPIVQAHPGLFTDDPRHGLCSSVAVPDDGEDGGVASASQPQAPVEQATKAPGEKRTTRRG